MGKSVAADTQFRNSAVVEEDKKTLSECLVCCEAHTVVRLEFDALQPISTVNQRDWDCPRNG